MKQDVRFTVNPSRLVRLFEDLPDMQCSNPKDLPDMQCSNPNSQFYVSPSVLHEKSKRGKKRNCGPKSSTSPATPSKHRKTVCPLPITSGESNRDSLEKGRDIERNASHRLAVKPKLTEEARIRPVSRELKRLYSDEGAANMLREVEGKARCERRKKEKQVCNLCPKEGRNIERNASHRTSSDKENSSIKARNSDKNRTTNTRRTPNITTKVPSTVRVDLSNDGFDSPTHEILYMYTSRPISAYDNAPAREPDFPLPEREDPCEIGLHNKGNTCYLNATLQSLFVLKDFVKDLERLFRNNENAHPCLKLFNSMALSRENGLPRQVDKYLAQFIDKFRLVHKTFSRIGQQQDAFEFFDKFLDIVRNGSPLGQPNPTEEHFLFQLNERLRCVECQHKLSRIQNCYSLCLPITEEDETLDDCFEAFLAEDEREGACKRCNSTNRKVSYCFETLPKTLVLMIKRYLGNNVKVSKEITAPDVLDLKKYIRPKGSIETKLKMVAKISHVGQTISSGHYIAHTLSDDGFWRLYDDAKPVMEVAEAWNDVKDAAYVYFYQLLPA